MKELKGFFPEDDLQQMLFNDEIKKHDYFLHHSQEMKDRYEKYCQSKNLDPNTESAADRFCNYILKREEKEHTEMLD